MSNNEVPKHASWKPFAMDGERAVMPPIKCVEPTPQITDEDKQPVFRVNFEMPNGSSLALFVTNIASVEEARWCWADRPKGAQLYDPNEDDWRKIEKAIHHSKTEDGILEAHYRRFTPHPGVGNKKNELRVSKNAAVIGSGAAQVQRENEGSRSARLPESWRSFLPGLRQCTNDLRLIGVIDMPTGPLFLLEDRLYWATPDPFTGESDDDEWNEDDGLIPKVTINFALTKLERTWYWHPMVEPGQHLVADDYSAVALTSADRDAAVKEIEQSMLPLKNRP